MTAAPGEVSKVRCAVVGAAGYSGGEVCRLLLGHPRAEIVGVFGSASRAEAEQTYGEVFPRFRGRLDLPVRAATHGAIEATKPDVVFLATPHEASVQLAFDLVKHDILTVDLSAAYRLRDPALYPVHYDFKHEHPGLLEKAVYGLVEANRAQIKGARLIAAPGCYPTSAILALRPLARAGAIREHTRPIVDAVSGVSGAGRAPRQGSLFSEVGVQPYGVMSHRHQPEISLHAGVEVVFTPHLAPLDRGIVSTIHVELAQGWTGERVRALFAEAYGGERFIRLLPAGAWPSTKAVERTNTCEIGIASDDARAHLIVCSAIDNLTKGAGGQAVQCMNVALGLPEAMGLEGL